MAARESAAMVKARKLVTEQGMTTYAAAQKVGLTRSAIYMAPWYKAWKATKNDSRRPLASLVAGGRRCCPTFQD